MDCFGFIYITTNLINNKKYIGKCANHRKDRDKYLGSGKLLRKAIKKYGKDNFSRVIIEECETESILNEREKYWISFYSATSNSEFYNIAEGGEGGNVYAGLTEEEKIAFADLKREISRRVCKRGGEHGLARKVICLNTMQVFDCIADAARFYNVIHEVIMSCCRRPGISKTAGADPITGERLRWEYYYEGKEYSYEPFKKDYTWRKSPILCRTTGLSFPSIREASKYYEITENCISHCLSGHTKTGGTNKETGERMVWIYKDRREGRSIA